MVRFLLQQSPPEEGRPIDGFYIHQEHARRATVYGPMPASRLPLSLVRVEPSGNFYKWSCRCGARSSLNLLARDLATAVKAAIAHARRCQTTPPGHVPRGW